MALSQVRRVLSIDPGTERCGWAILEAEPGMRSAFKALGINVIVLPELPLLARFGHLTRQLRVIVARAKEHGVTRAAIERPFVNKNHMATLAIAGARAIAAGLAGEAGMTVVDYPPQTWKLMTGHGGADKDRVANVVKSLLNIDDDLPYDATDAGGIGIYDLSSR
ncbi:MAG TPA: crossover junction endodeoxyribonuclease RuvC [Planctomycetota bacterium]|nr:crossover junction endodeoxyribonuclease RuvC [Planctomycetota bacterium]